MKKITVDFCLGDEIEVKSLKEGHSDYNTRVKGYKIDSLNKVTYVDHHTSYTRDSIITKKNNYNTIELPISIGDCVYVIHGISLYEVKVFHVDIWGETDVRYTGETMNYGQRSFRKHFFINKEEAIEVYKKFFKKLSEECLNDPINCTFPYINIYNNCNFDMDKYLTS
jgi:hypothetical protein